MPVRSLVCIKLCGEIKPSDFGDSLFTHDKELVPFSMHSPSDVSTGIVFLLTQTIKRHRTHLGNRLQKTKEKEFQIIDVSSVSVVLLTVRPDINAPVDWA